MSAVGTATLLVRYGMVMLFLPFSAVDKVLGFYNAVKQAQGVFKPRLLAIAVLMIGLAIEVLCTLGFLTGVADRACAFIIAGYCAATGALFKPFWTEGDFLSDPNGKGRGLFWDFLKNLSLGAGFLLLVIGTDGSGLQTFIHHPFASTHPYGSAQ